MGKYIAMVMLAATVAQAGEPDKMVFGIYNYPQRDAYLDAVYGPSRSDTGSHSVRMWLNKVPGGNNGRELKLRNRVRTSGPRVGSEVEFRILTITKGLDRLGNVVSDAKYIKSDFMVYFSWSDNAPNVLTAGIVRASDPSSLVTRFDIPETAIDRKLVALIKSRGYRMPGRNDMSRLVPVTRFKWVVLKVDFNGTILVPKRR